MKNKSILVISVLFSLMLLGIVLIQAWWIKRSLRLNEQAFDSAVYRSLEGVVKQTEENENFSFIKREYAGDTIIKSAKKLKVIKSPSSKKPIYASVSNSIKINVDSDSGKQTKTVIRIEKNNNGTKTIENSIIIGSGEKLELPEPPPIPPVPAIVSEEKIEDIEVLVKKMTHIKNPDSITIKPNEIEKIIFTQLKQNNLPDKFSFGLLKKNGTYFFKSPSFKDTTSSYLVNLYPNDLFGREVALALFFPEKFTHIRSDIWWVFVLSLLFTVAILILFIYSIRMLVRHKKMLENKNDFINHMSHEFKTPLAGISLGADLLIDKPEQMNAEQINKVAQIIKKQSARLNKEVNDVLLSAQLEENINRGNITFNLVEAIKTQLEMFQLQLENKNVKIESHFEPENISVLGDEMLWQKVFSNLLDNSIKFSKENPEILISISKVKSLIKIEFSDNGIGIAEKDLPHIFEKYYRSDYYKKSNIHGFGLGLSFVKKVVGTHRGIIKAESQPGKGTKITIEINA